MSKKKKKKGRRPYVKKEVKVKEKRFTPRTVSSEWYYGIKLIAIAAMVCSHLSMTAPFANIISYDALLTLRMIGYIAMPLFAWELVECFHHTEHKYRHLIEIAILMVVSEIPRDYCIDSTVLNFDRQNICYDLMWSWIMLAGMNFDWNKLTSDLLGIKNEKFRKFFQFFAKRGIALPCIFFAYFTGANFGYQCIGLIYLFEIAYQRKHKRLLQFFFLCTYIGSYSINGTTMQSGLAMGAIFCFIPIFLAETECHFKPFACYEKLIKKRAESGIKPQTKNPVGSFVTSKPVKIIGRVFYPVHFAILAVIKLVANM